MRMLFEDLVGAREDRWRDGQSELGGFEIDDQFREWPAEPRPMWKMWERYGDAELGNAVKSTVMSRSQC
jgi:hypothetical protein